MKKFFALLFLITLFGSTLWAQTGGTISGQITAGQQKILEAATVALLRAADSSAVKFTLANKEGAYFFEGIAEGRYLISASAVSHATAYTAPFELSKASPAITLPVIELQAVSKSLSGITITARKPFIEQKMDRMIVNVDASLTNAGTTALEVLEKSPGVTVDKDGNISLKGKQGIMVLMDGRPAYLSGTDLTNYLKNLPSSALEQIEIMTNPPAKYDAAGNAGVINIKTKKNKAKGFNGNVTLNYSQGIYWKTNNSVNANYRTGKVNVFANLGQSQWNGIEALDIKRTYRNAASKNVTAIFEQTSKMLHRNGAYNLKLGADFFLTPSTTLGIVSSGFYNPENDKSFNTSFLMNPSRHVDSIVYATSNNTNKWKNGSVNLNLRHQFDSLGTELTADLDYLNFSTRGHQNFSNTTLSPNWVKLREKIISSNLPINIDIYAAKTDFAHSFKSGYKFEAGAKTSFVKTTNSAFYYNILSGGEVVDYTKTNQFLYNENINAAYVNLNKEFGKWGIQTGLRFENTNYNGKQFGNPTKADSSFKKSYGSLFPTLYVSYNPSEKNSFGINIGRRIERPAYQDLNPFLFFLDEYTYQAGNPFIRPQFTTNMELTHTYHGFLTTTLNYGYTKDYMMETFKQEKVSATSNGFASIITKGNIGKVNNAGIAINAQLPLKKWWDANVYTNINYSRFRGDVEGEPIDVTATNVLFNLNNQFKFAKVWSAELSGFYRTKGVEGQLLINPLGQASAGISRQIMAGKATMKLAVRDMFRTNQASGNLNFSTTEASFKNHRDSRVATLTFTYRFGKPLKGAQPRRKSGGADDEQNRVKTGGNN